MTALPLTMTIAGLARFTAAQASDDIDLTIATVGLTATAFSVAPTLTALPGEFRRIATISGSAVGDNIVHMVIRDDGALAYDVRGFGLFLADGTLFAVYGQADPIVGKSVASSMLIALDIAFPTADITQLTFGDTNFLNPPATTVRKGVARLALLSEIDAGLAQDSVVTPAGLRRALPIGLVMLWYGSAATVPVGWAICNGQAVARSDGAGNIATPDLRDRVAVGANAQAVGATFGATSKTATSGSGGAHTPSGKVPNITVTSTRSTTGETIATTTKTDVAGNGSATAVTGVTRNDPGHTHDVSITGNPALLMDAVGGHSHDVTLDVTQPSLALHYIMKV